MLLNLARRFSKKRQSPCRFFVESEEPFEDSLVIRGPLTKKDADAFIALNTACGSIDRLYEDIGEGILVPV